MSHPPLVATSVVPLVADFGLPAECQFHFDRAANEPVADHLIRPLATAACSFARTSGHLAVSTEGPPFGGAGDVAERTRHNFTRLGLDYAELEELVDIDTPDDYQTHVGQS